MAESWFMQFAKDSFYMALRERLAGLCPGRTVTVNGVTRPAVIVRENELPTAAEPLAGAFYVEWGGARVIERHAGGQPLAGMECEISYHTYGSVESGVDRGRQLAALDHELLSICRPPQTRKRDYSQTPSVDLGTGVFWTEPVLEEAGNNEFRAEARRQRKARLTVFFFPEVDLP